jgi:hypothetical protein
MTRKKRKFKNNINQMILLAAMIIIIVAASIIIFTRMSDEEETPASTGATIDPQKLAGHWLRPDGGYILEFTNIGDDGSLDAAYFNPNPINIAECKWHWNGTHLQIFVKFDDVNYQGSTYDLIYLPQQDRMTGNYFQAMMGQNFDVVFIRKEE